jgi:acyl-coenzyme A synthetase/AMP-(fatty) acid ligase
VPGVEIAAAYGRPNPITGQIVALDLVVSEGADPDAVKAAVIAACEALPAAGRPRRIKVVEELEIRGNKLLRQAT